MSRVLMIPTPAFTCYQEKRLTNLRALGPTLRLGAWLQSCGVNAIGPVPAAKDWMACHPWRPGWLPLTDAEADEVRAGRGGAEVAQRGWLAEGPEELNGLCVRAILDFGALQNPWEVKQFLTRVVARRPRTIVEIGTSAGGLLFAIAQLAHPDATLISIDLPNPRDSLELRAAVPRVLASLVQPTQKLVTFQESSMIHDVKEDVRHILDGRAVDLLVIDGDHSYGAVRSDFDMYSPLVAPGGLIAFHDVLVRPENSGRGLDVGIFWQELVGKHRTETLVDHEGVPGVLAQQQVPFASRRRAALGWGLLVV